MIVRSFYIANHQDRFLRDRKTLTVSEHIRRAIEDYIQKVKKEELNVSTSKSV